jgi:small-conductance mechanosensitive channel
VQAALVSLSLVLLAYLAARLLSGLLGRLLLGAAARSSTTLDDQLVEALRVPLTRALFLCGVYAACHHLPLPAPWLGRADQVLFVLAVLLVSLALTRAYVILVGWYATESRLGSENALARAWSPLLSKLGKLLVGLLAGVTLLEHFGVNVSSLVVSLGVSSLAVGLAAQDTLANMFAGFTLMLDRPFVLGERIQLASGEVGDVESIGMRATSLRTLDETLLVIPNSQLVKERLVNQSRPSRRLAARVEVGVAYDSDLAQVKAILVAAACASPYVAPEPEPVAVVVRFADGAVLLRVGFQARDYLEQGLALSDVHEQIHRRFAEAGIVIPIPARRVIQEVAGEAGRPASCSGEPCA